MTSSTFSPLSKWSDNSRYAFATLADGTILEIHQSRTLSGRGDWRKYGVSSTRGIVRTQDGFTRIELPNNLAAAKAALLAAV